jgi:hypothetical protein
MGFIQKGRHFIIQADRVEFESLVLCILNSVKGMEINDYNFSEFAHKITGDIFEMPEDYPEYITPKGRFDFIDGDIFYHY